jgi:hypothetical protein
MFWILRLIRRRDPFLERS